MTHEHRRLMHFRLNGDPSLAEEQLNAEDDGEFEVVAERFPLVHTYRFMWGTKWFDDDDDAGFFTVNIRIMPPPSFEPVSHSLYDAIAGAVAPEGESLPFYDVEVKEPQVFPLPGPGVWRFDLYHNADLHGFWELDVRLA